MTLVHVAIPHAVLEETQEHWLPLLRRVARRSKNSIAELVGQAMSGEIQLHVAWDPEEKQAHAIAGMRVFLRNGQRVADWVWMTGRNRERWMGLRSDLERYMKEQCGCVAMRIETPNIKKPINWVEHLEADGYRQTHVMMEREL